MGKTFTEKQESFVLHPIYDGPFRVCWRMGEGVVGGGEGRSKMPLFLGTVKWLQFGAMGVGHLDTNNRVETMIDKTQLYHWMLHKLVGFST